MSNAAPTKPEILFLTEFLDKALDLPESVTIRKPLIDAIREVLVEYIARAAVTVFLEENEKYKNA